MNYKNHIIPREIIFGNPDKTHAQISPDAGYLAYLASSEKGVLNVYIRTIGLEDDVMITSDEYRGIRFYTWTYNNNIIFVQDNNGDENFHLYRVEIENKKMTDLTPFGDVKVGAIFTHRDYPDEIIISMNKRDRSVFDLYRLHLKSGKLDVDTENPGDVTSWAVFKIRVASAVNPVDGSIIIRVRDTVEDKWREFLTAPFDENVSVITIEFLYRNV
jgi:hypothetical protein